MKLKISFFILLWMTLAHSASPLERIRRLKSSHPAFADAIVQLQSDYLKEKKWEHVLGVGQVFRIQIAPVRSQFRVDPFLMEAYALIQYCRYSDARAVLDQAQYFAGQFENPDALRKLEKARELEKLTQLYRNLTPVIVSQSNFSNNEIAWQVDPGNKELFDHLDAIIIRVNSECR